MVWWNRKYQKERWIHRERVKTGERRDSLENRMRNIRDPIIPSWIAHSFSTHGYMYVPWAYISSFADLTLSLPQSIPAAFPLSFCVTLHSQPRDTLTLAKVQFPEKPGWNSAPCLLFLFTWGHWMDFIHESWIFNLLTGGVVMLASKRCCRNARHSCDVLSSQTCLSADLTNGENTGKKVFFAWHPLSASLSAPFHPPCPSTLWCTSLLPEQWENVCS